MALVTLLVENGLMSRLRPMGTSLRNQRATWLLFW